MTTQRLHIRRFVDGDWSDLYEYLSDAEVVRYEPYPPVTLDQSKELAEQRAASVDFWAVCLLDGGKLIGNVYLAEAEAHSWELGYVFNRAYQGKGYATEAVERLLGHIYQSKGAHRVFAQCNPENTASWKLLERVGFRREGHLKKNVSFHTDEHGSPVWQDTLLYGLLGEEWQMIHGKRLSDLVDRLQ